MAHIYSVASITTTIPAILPELRLVIQQYFDIVDCVGSLYDQ